MGVVQTFFYFIKVKTKKESRTNVWTFWIFICRTDISANADDSQFDMDERAAFALMVMYEIWWVRYFRSERRLADFYSSFLGIPVAALNALVLHIKEL